MRVQKKKDNGLGIVFIIMFILVLTLIPTIYWYYQDTKKENNNYCQSKGFDGSLTSGSFPTIECYDKTGRLTEIYNSNYGK